MKIGDYFSGIERSLRRIKSAEIHGQVTCLASDDYPVFFDVGFYFGRKVISTCTK